MNNPNKLARTTTMIIIFTFSSKIMGFMREVLIAAKFGSGFETDTYVVALTAIGLVSGLVGIVITTTLIPVLTETEEKEGKEAKIRLTNNIINTIIIISIGIYLIGIGLAPVIVKLVAKSFVGNQLQFATKLTRIGLPIVIITGLNSVLTGYLHSDERFSWSALGGIAFNAVYILFLLFFAKIHGIEGLMVAGVIGYISKVILQIPDLIKSGFRYRMIIDWKDGYLKNFAMLTIPIYAGTVMDEINLILDKTFASGLEAGSISALNYANKLNGLILGVFISAIATVIFPMLAKEFGKDSYDEIKRITSYGINLILIITIPSVVGLIILSEPIVTIAFQRGEFNTKATMMTSNALIFYSMGLISMGIGSIVTKVYYSLQDTKTPTISVAISLSINVVFNIILVKAMGHSGLALSTSIATTAATFFMLYGLRRKIGPMGIKSYLICALKSGIASGIMGAVAYLIYHGVYGILGSSEVHNLISLFLAAGSGVILYLALCYLLGVNEIKDMLSALKSRLSNN